MPGPPAAQELGAPSELARYTGLSCGSTTAMLDRLERGGLIERRPKSDNRRGTLIAIHRAGAERVGPLFASVRKAQDALVAAYSRDELQLFVDFLLNLAAIWEAERKKLEL